MNAPAKTVVMFIGLPYTGKTTLIERLQEAWPGEAIYADEIFTRTVSPAQISLSRWLQEGPRLIARIQTIIQQSAQERFFVELGTMQARPRAEFICWCREQGYNIMPIWCRCQNSAALHLRRQARAEEIGEKGANAAKIDITLGDLYRRIQAAFERPSSEEGYFVIDTCRPLDESLATIHQLLISAA